MGKGDGAALFAWLGALAGVAGYVFHYVTESASQLNVFGHQIFNAQGQYDPVVIPVPNALAGGRSGTLGYKYSDLLGTVGGLIAIAAGVHAGRQGATHGYIAALLGFVTLAWAQYDVWVG